MSVTKNSQYVYYMEMEKEVSELLAFELAESWDWAGLFLLSSNLFISSSLLGVGTFNNETKSGTFNRTVCLN